MERISRRTFLIGGGVTAVYAAVVGGAVALDQSLENFRRRQPPPDLGFPIIDPVTDQEREDQVNIAGRFINAGYFRGQEPEVFNISPGIYKQAAGGMPESAEILERVVTGNIKTASGQEFSIANNYDYYDRLFLRANLRWGNDFRTARPQLIEFTVPNRKILLDQSGLILEDTLEDLLRAVYNLPEGLSASVREYNISWGSFGSEGQIRGQFKVRAVELSGRVDDSYFASMTQEGEASVKVSFNT